MNMDIVLVSANAHIRFMSMSMFTSEFCPAYVCQRPNFNDYFRGVIGQIPMLKLLYEYSTFNTHFFIKRKLPKLLSLSTDNFFTNDSKDGRNGQLSAHIDPKPAMNRLHSVLISTHSTNQLNVSYIL
jgi:hypothetical protein